MFFWSWKKTVLKSHNNKSEYINEHNPDTNYNDI